MLKMTLLSVDSAGIQGNGWSGDVSISSDGRYVAFETDATNLVAGDTNGRPDIMVRDLVAGETTRVSVSSSGEQATTGNNYDASISGDGRFVTFESADDNLAVNDTNGLVDVLVRDLLTETTSLVSAVQGSSFLGEISENGQYVTFANRGATYQRDLILNTTTQITVPDYDPPALGSNLNPQSVSAGGRFVPFVAAPNFNGDNPNPLGRTNLFVRDVLAGTTTRLLTNSTDDNVFTPVISEDGRFVVFRANEPGSSPNIFRHNLQTGQNEVVNSDADGNWQYGFNYGPDVSADGRFVVFGKSGAGVTSEIYVKDMDSGALQIVSVADDGTTANGSSIWANISADGSVISFQSEASNLVDGDTNDDSDVFAVQNPLYDGAADNTGNRAPEWRAGLGIDDIITALDNPDTNISINLNDYFTDPDGDTLLFDMSGINSGLILNPLTGAIKGRFTGDLVPDDYVSFGASDPSTASISTGTAIGGFGPPTASDPWVFDYAAPFDLMTFAHLSLDSYNGDRQASQVTSNLLHPPEGWSVLLTTYDGVGARPSAGGVLVPTIAPTSDGMQATAYYQEGTGRVVIAYRGTDDDGELLSASIPMGLGEQGVTGALQPKQYMQAAVDFYAAVATGNRDGQSGTRSVETDMISFTGHSLGGILAGYLSGLTGNQGMVFASGPHSELVERLHSAITIPDDIGLNPEFDFDNLQSTRVTGEVLGLGVNTALDVADSLNNFIQTIDTYNPLQIFRDWVRPTINTKNIAELSQKVIDRWGGAVLEGTPLEFRSEAKELSAGFDFIHDLGAIELHSMALHHLLTYAEYDLELKSYADADGFMKALFDPEITESGYQVIDAQSTNARMVNEIALTQQDGRSDVLTPLLRDINDLVAPVANFEFGSTRSGSGSIYDFDSSDVVRLLSEVAVEMAWRGVLSEQETGTPSPYSSASLAKGGAGDWLAVDLTAQGAGTWAGIEKFYDAIDARGINKDAISALALATGEGSTLFTAGNGAPSESPGLEDFADADRIVVKTAGSRDQFIGSDSNEIFVGYRSLTGEGVRIDGGGGDDLLIGTSANDLLLAGTGRDMLLGGDGDDIYEATGGLGSHVVIGDSGGEDTLFIGANNLSINVNTFRYGGDLEISLTNGLKIDVLDFFNPSAGNGQGVGLISGRGSIESIENEAGEVFRILSGVEKAVGVVEHAIDAVVDAAQTTGSYIVTTAVDTKDTIVGSVSSFANNVFSVFSFGEEDEVRILSGPGSLLPQQFSFEEGSVIVNIDEDMDGTTDATFKLEGDYEDYEARAVSEGDDVVIRLSLREAAFDQLGDDGNDLLTGTANNDLIGGGAGNDRLRGRVGDDTLLGGLGDDVLDGAQGANELKGGVGNDLFLVSSAEDVVIEYLDEGQDTVEASVDWRLSVHVEELRLVDTAVVGFGNDLANRITGNAMGNTLAGAGGSDNIDGGHGNDLIDGGEGWDWITPGEGSDTIDGGDGNDMLSFVTLADTPGRTNVQYRLDLDLTAGTATTSGSDVYTISNVERVTGSIFADRIKGDAGDNQLRGLGDYDWFTATTGADTIDGGTGQDMISYVDWLSDAVNTADTFNPGGAPPPNGEVTGVVVDLNDTSNNTNLAAGHEYISVERVTGSGRQDVFYGDENENDFRGLGDFDWFVGSTGGRERYFGGDGGDTVTYYNSTSGVSASLRNGAKVGGEETGRGTAGDAALDLYFSIENLVGTNFADSLTGNEQRNNLNGLNGDDFIFGYGGIDVMKGGKGNDVINGGAGSDYALFDGNKADTQLFRTAANEVRSNGAEGFDIHTDVEYFRFSDGDVSIWELAVI